MDKDLIKRINELAKKKKTLGLNAEEQAEQKQLYAVYLAEIREQFDNTLDNVSIKGSLSIVGVIRKNRIYDSNKRQIIKLSLVFLIDRQTYAKYDCGNA